MIPISKSRQRGVVVASAMFSFFAVGCTSPAVSEAGQDIAASSEYSLMAVHKTSNLSDVCSVKVSEPEPSDLSTLAGVTLAEAEAVALGVFANTTVLKSELENENGCLVYGFELSSGTDAKVDAGNGVFLYADSGEDGGTESDHQDND